MKENPEFDYGEVVRVKASAPVDKHPGQLASICGFRQVVRPIPHANDENKCEVTLVLVEFPGGESIEIEEDLLERARIEKR